MEKKQQELFFYEHENVMSGYPDGGDLLITGIPERYNTEQKTFVEIYALPVDWYEKYFGEPVDIPMVVVVHPLEICFLAKNELEGMEKAKDLYHKHLHELPFGDWLLDKKRVAQLMGKTCRSLLKHEKKLNKQCYSEKNKAQERAKVMLEHDSLENWLNKTPISISSLQKDRIAELCHKTNFEYVEPAVDELSYSQANKVIHKLEELVARFQVLDQKKLKSAPKHKKPRQEMKVKM